MVAVEQINNLIGAFTKLKCYLGDCDELLRTEAERVSIFREIEDATTDLETRSGTLSPRTKKDKMAKLIDTLGRAVQGHAGLRDNARRRLSFLESAPFSLQQVQGYGPYLDNCQTILMKNLLQLHQRMASGEFDFQPQRKQPVMALPQVSQVQVRQVSDEDFIRTWYFDERNFDPNEAYRIDTTYRLHEAAKARSAENLPPKMRYDISSLLVYTSSGKDLNWRLMTDLVDLFSGWFNRQTNSQTNRSGIDFKESSSRLRKQIDVHLENCSRYDNSQVDPVIGKYYTLRSDAEKKLRLLIESGMGLYGACDRLQAEVFKVERVFEYSNKPLFYALNNTAVALIEVNNLTSEWVSTSTSEAQSEFSMKSRNHAEGLTRSVVQFTGSGDLRPFLQFVQQCRNMQDVNEMHQGILFQLEEALVLTGLEANKKIAQQCKLYMSLREDKLMPQFQSLLDIQAPSMFSSVRKEDLLSIKRTIDENAELLVLVHDFLQENTGTANRGLTEVNESKRRLKRQLADGVKESNPVIRKWCEQYVRAFLAEY